MSQLAVKAYLRQEHLPHLWCPGCGNGIITGAIIRAIATLNLDPGKVCIVSGIGCSSRAASYMNFNTLHTTHGRAIPFATGLKLARPELTVIVITGDGDAAAIGGNHLIHAARRNIDLTAVCFNNNIYGMTSGQYSPLTPKSKKAATAPYGNIENNFDLCRLVIAAGASYVARGTAYHVRSLIRLITRGIRHRGFAFIEALSPCPTYYGRINGLDSAISMLQWQKEHALDIKAASRKRPYELEDKIIIGELFNSEARGLNIPEFSQEYWNLIKRVKDK